VLEAGNEVHVFGRGLATLRAATGTVLTSEAAVATVNELVIRREAGGPPSIKGAVEQGRRAELRRHKRRGQL